MKKFSKNIEDFICENCGAKVRGNGFTNHCPNCFYSKHVDINPGDRNCKCSGLMFPVAVLQKNDTFYIQHKCEKCGFMRKNSISLDDNMDNLFKLVKTLAEKGLDELYSRRVMILNKKLK
jgi:predicted RNA-binding Zn-ribbon protein involved in translation (DUF1610 family)